MLLEFKIGGYCSFKEMQELYLTPYPGTRIKNTKYEDNFFEIKKNRVMKSSVIFGSNASGKTNLVLGLERFIEIIQNGLDLKKDFSENKLNNSSESIKFEISVLGKDEKIYNYYLEYNFANIIEEHLTCNEKIIFKFENNSLESNSKKISTDIEKVFSIKSTETILKKLKDFEIEEITMLIEESKNIVIKRDLLFNLESKNIKYNINKTGKEKLEKEKEKVLDILKLLDYTICDFQLEKDGDINKEEIYQVIIIRENTENNERKNYYLRDESEGIKKIMNLIYDILDIYEGKTIFIDELDSSISTQTLIQIFNNIVNTKNNSKGQLIVTSHNLFLFNNNIFEPQQIYIVNKKIDLTSEIYSLSEFNIRTEKENLYQDFLKGKFGGMNG
ncbi:ATP-binding protein [Cetobacterium sp. 8H]|uniref:AAA family ATPase n=1 Tax=Cetobacterium sp. 8H TaxID=2759681 RepID=UPI00163B860D|nr:AAA family ATPase [Cetobacterium sp. 8H]MBC2850004.1 ATP-binding protein [Cetobacterium sp. 8H]